MHTEASDAQPCVLLAISETNKGKLAIGGSRCGDVNSSWDYSLHISESMGYIEEEKMYSNCPSLKVLKPLQYEVNNDQICVF